MTPPRPDITRSGKEKAEKLLDQSNPSAVHPPFRAGNAPGIGVQVDVDRPATATWSLL